MSMITENVDVDVWRSRHTGGLFVRIETVGTIERVAAGTGAVRAILTPDEARAVAAALIAAADRLSGPTGGE